MRKKVVGIVTVFLLLLTPWLGVMAGEWFYDLFGYYFKFMEKSFCYGAFAAVFIAACLVFYDTWKD